ncbi:MAG: extracellular solute-binding protein [Polyangiaceae bacterium]|nr:extracellular solute-binding protein [Polyangiaceae bacterium]
MSSLSPRRGRARVAPAHLVRVALAALVTLFALGLPGCAAERGPAPIRLWHAYRGDEERALAALVATWPGPPVELLALPADAFAAKLQAAIPLGAGPDVYIDAHERLGDFRARGIVAPVGDALEEGAFAPEVLAAVEQQGVAYGVPLTLKSAALYVNDALVPTDPPDLESIAELRLPEGVYPLAYEAENAYFHAAVLHAFGGSFLAPAGEPGATPGASDAFGFVGEPAERSLELVRSLVDRGVVPADADGALVTRLFAAGKAATAISGPWLANDLPPETPHFRVIPLPKVRAAGGTPLRPMLTVEALMLSPAGAARPEVRAFARFVASTEGTAVLRREARAVPARRDAEGLLEGEALRRAFDDPALAADALVSAFAAQARVAIPMPTSVAMRATWEPAARAIKKVLRGDTAPAEALAEAKQRFDDARPKAVPAARPEPLVAILGVLCLAAAFWLVRRARQREFRASVRRSLPAYAYVLHSVVVLGVLVFVPLFAGAAISLAVGRPGELTYVGGYNFVEILTARGGPLFASGSFYLVLLVTLAWTAVNLFFHLGIGLVLGLLLSRPTLRLKALYRVLLIIPWAVPSYVTALAWKGMFHRQFGAVSALLSAVNDVFGTDLESIAWFSRFSTAFAANCTTNIWLGFPFMMVVTLAGLTAIPKDVLEAAEVDGATRWQRLWHVTLPLLRPTVMPAAVLGAVWTFNMFNVVFLVSGGEPDGQTDILVSEAYRWAFTREAQYGFAAAYSVLIFLLLFAGTELPGLVRRWRARRRPTPRAEVAS